MVKKLCAGLLVSALMLSLCACGGSDKAEPAAEDTPVAKTEKTDTKEEKEEKHRAGDIVGQWKCVSITTAEMGTINSEECIETYGFDMPGMFSFSAWESGYCAMAVDENVEEEDEEAGEEDSETGDMAAEEDALILCWEKENNNYTLTIADPEMADGIENVSLKFDGETLVLTMDNVKMESESGVDEEGSEGDGGTAETNEATTEKNTEIYNFEYVGEPEISIYSFCPELTSEDVMKMGSFMKGARAIVLEDKAYCLEAKGYLASAGISKDGSDVVLEDIKDLWNGEVCYPCYFQYADGYVYAVLTEGSSQGIIRINTENDKVEVIYDQPADYLQAYDGKLYFTDTNYHYYSMDLDGKNITPIIEDRAVYYPYQLGDGWMIFQDDADGETLHIRHIGENIERRITEVKSFEPVISGNYLYFQTTEDRVHDRIGRVNLRNGQTEISEYFNSGECLFEEDAVIVEGAVYPLDQWNQDLDPDPDNCEEYYFYTDGKYRYYNRHFMCWYAPDSNFGGYSAQVWIDE